MQSGMQAVMGPNLMQFLRLLDWEHLESRVCGEKTVDVDKLKSITRYQNCTESHAVIKRFWRVFTTLDDD